MLHTPFTVDGQTVGVMHKTIVSTGLSLALLAVAACLSTPGVPQGATPVSDFVDAPVYEEPVTVFGQVESLGELFCTCFILREGGIDVTVWYDSMVEDGISRPAVSVDDIENGDWATVDGELKRAGTNVNEGSFWATAIAEVP